MDFGPLRGRKANTGAFPAPENTFVDHLKANIIMAKWAILP